MPATPLVALSLGYAVGSIPFAFLIGLWHGLPAVARHRRRVHEESKETHRYA